MSPFRVLFVVLVVSLSACKSGGGGGSSEKVTVDFRHNPTGKGTPVATFGQDSITQEELEKRFAEMSPQVRARYQTVEERKTFLENLVRFELLAQEAARQGLANDPDVVMDAKRLMVNKLLEKRVSAAGTPAPNEGELAAFYVQHQADFVRAEMYRLSLIFVSVGKDAKEKALKKAEAEELKKQVSALPPNDFIGFGKLAHERSEDVRTQVVNGDTTLKPVDDLTQAYGAEVTAAAQKLTHQGEVSDLITTPKGYFLVKLSMHTPPLDRKLEDPNVRQQLMSRVSYEKRTQTLDRYVVELKEAGHYTLQPEALAHVKVDPTLPATLAPGRPGGVLPLPMTGRAPISPAGVP